MMLVSPARRFEPSALLLWVRSYKFLQVAFECRRNFHRAQARQKRDAGFDTCKNFQAFEQRIPPTGCDAVIPIEWRAVVNVVVFRTESQRELAQESRRKRRRVHVSPFMK